MLQKSCSEKALHKNVCDKDFLGKVAALKMRPEFGACRGVYFLVKLRSEVAIQTFQSNF